MTDLANLFSNKKRERISTSSQESVTPPEQKKTKNISEKTDEIIVALNMAGSLSEKLDEVLKKLESLEKLDSIEASITSMKEGLEFLGKEVEDLKKKEKEHEQEFSKLQSQQRKSEETIEELKTRDLGRESRVKKTRRKF